jgi:hypothetical protein
MEEGGRKSLDGVHGEGEFMPAGSQLRESTLNEPS